MRALPALLVTLAAGCADPSLAVKIDVSDSVLAEHLHPTDGSAAPDVRVRLRVIDAAQATRPAWPRGLAPVDPDDISAPRHRSTGPATCAELELGRIPAEVIDTATLTRPSDGVTDLTGVPRLGAKLFVAEMLEDGRRIGLGCAELADIDVDTVVTVPVRAAARVVRLPRLIDSDDPVGGAAWLATAPWKAATTPPPLPGRAVEIDRYAGGVASALPITAMTDAFGTPPFIPLVDGPTPPGPVQALVHVQGADEALRIGQWQPWPHAAGDASTLRLAPAPGAAVAGTSGPVRVGEHARWSVAATYVGADGRFHLDVVGGNAGTMVHLEAGDVPDVARGAPVIANGALWLVGADGWHRVTLEAMARLGIAAADPVEVASGPAVDATVVPACGNDAGLILVRRTVGAPYTAYREPGVPADTADALVAAIGGDRVRATPCVAGTPTPSGLIVTESATGARRLITGRGRALTAPGLGALDDLTTGATVGPGLVAFISDTGPRARSFVFASFAGQESKALVPTQAIDAPLAMAPVALTATHLDGDGALDLIALYPGDDSVQLQVVLGLEVEGQPLTAVSDPIPVGPAAGRHPRILVVDADGLANDPRDEVVVLTDTGLDVFAP